MNINIQVDQSLFEEDTMRDFNSSTRQLKQNENNYERGESSYNVDVTIKKNSNISIKTPQKSLFSNISPQKKQIGHDPDINKLTQENSGANQLSPMPKPIFSSLMIQAKHIQNAPLNPLSKYDPNSLYILSRENILRKAIIKLINNKFFDYFIILIIFANTILLAVRDYNDPESYGKKNQILDIIDLVFTCIYTIEALLKILGLGLIMHKHSYLRDAWNSLDFIIVIVSLISLLPNIPNLKSLRTLRVIRLLRSIKAVPSMKRLVSSLLLSLPQIANVVLFLFFIFLIFGILGIQTFSGVQYNRCRLTPEPIDNFNNWPIDYSQKRLCGGHYQCNENTYCGNLLEYNIDIDHDNVTKDDLINFNIHNYDNIVKGLLAVFLAIMLEGWTAHMWNYLDSTGFFAAIFYLTLVFIGSFFLLNLFLAVIMNIFTEMDQRVKDQEAELIRKEEVSKGINHAFGNALLERIKNDGKEDEKNKKASFKKNKRKTAGNIMMKYKLLQATKENLEETQNDPIKSGEKTSELFQLNENMTNRQNKKQDQDFEDTSKLDIQQLIFSDPRRSHLEKFKSVFLRIVQNKWFQGFITLMIIGNTICLSLDQYPADPDLISILDGLNMAFFVIFAIEMIIKLIGLGFKGYIKDRFNIFDGTIIILSIVDVSLSYSIYLNSDSTNNGGGAISAFRAFRLLRVLKLIKQWRKLQELLNTIINSLKDIQNFSVLLFLFMFTYALLGLELFANKVKFDDEGNLDLENGISPRRNFDDFITACITIFILLTGCSWDAILYDLTRAKGSISVFFTLSYIVIGQLILLNLFLAILLKNFDESSLVERVENTDEQVKNERNLLVVYLIKLKDVILSTQFCKSRKERYFDSQNDQDRSTTHLKKSKSVVDAGFMFEQAEKKGTAKQQLEQSDSLEISNIDMDEMQKEEEQKELEVKEERKKANQALGLFQKQKGSIFASGFDNKSDNKASYKRKQSIANIITAKAKENQNDQDICKGTSLIFLTNRNRFRILIAKIVQQKYFEYVVLVFIIMQSILLAIDNPLNDPDGTLELVIFYCDIVFTCIFVLESLMKIITNGFLLNGKQSYLRSPWNFIDFFIALLSLTSLFYSNSKLSTIKALRLLRVLRPLRIISRNQGLKLAVSALLLAIPHIINVIIIALLFFIIFSIISVNYLKGTFFYCSISPDSTENISEMFQDLVKSKFDCVNYGGAWVNADKHFDNIMSSILALFTISTTEGWVDLMNQAIDSVGIDMQPITDHNLYWSIFFIIFLVIGNFFVLNLFVGVVISTFNREKDKLGKNFLLTNKQRQWLEEKKLCMRIQPKVFIDYGIGGCRDKLRRIVMSRGFEIFIMTCIILNTIVLAITWYGEPEKVTMTTEYINYFFAIVFTLEAILKIIGLGFKKYFKDYWNCFDCFVVVGTIISTIVTVLTTANIGAATTFIRVFKISRIFRLIRRANRLQIIFETFIVTIPALTNVGGLLALFLYIYSILGMFLFAEVKLQTTLNDQTNFQTFGASFLTMVRAATGENWDMIMIDAARGPSEIFECDDSGIFNYQKYIDNDMPLIFLNLFIAIILQGFDEMNQKESILVKEDELERFREVWAEFDKLGSGFINLNDLPKFLLKLGPKLGWDNSYKDDQEKQDDFLEDMNIQTYNKFKQYLFWDVLQGLIKLLMVKTSANKVDGNSFFNSLDDRKPDQLQNNQDQSNSQNSSFEKLEKTIHVRLELEFENYDESKNVILAVQDVKQKEHKVKKHIIIKQDQHLSSAHVKAGRKICQVMCEYKERRQRKMNRNMKNKLKGNLMNLGITQEQMTPKPQTQQLDNQINWQNLEQNVEQNGAQDRPANHQESSFDSQIRQIENDLNNNNFENLDQIIQEEFKQDHQIQNFDNLRQQHQVNIHVSREKSKKSNEYMRIASNQENSNSLDLEDQWGQDQNLRQSTKTRKLNKHSSTQNAGDKVFSPRKKNDRF